MEVTNVQLRGNTLYMTLNPPYADAQKLVYKFKRGAYELVPAKKKKRSLNANNFLWACVTNIAAVAGRSAEDVYRQAVRDYGVCDKITMRCDAAERFSRDIWPARGIAWFTVMLDSDGENSDMLAYYGSSCYDTQQMSRLLEGVIQEARNLDIETLSERELSLLLDNWKKEGTRDE